jgi:hypothetical protein
MQKKGQDKNNYNSSALPENLVNMLNRINSRLENMDNINGAGASGSQQFVDYYLTSKGQDRNNCNQRQ